MSSNHPQFFAFYMFDAESLGPNTTFDGQYMIVVCISRNPGQNGGQACALHATMGAEQNKKCMVKYSCLIIAMA